MSRRDIQFLVILRVRINRQVSLNTIYVYYFEGPVIMLPIYTLFSTVLPKSLAESRIVLYLIPRISWLCLVENTIGGGLMFFPDPGVPLAKESNSPVGSSS